MGAGRPGPAPVRWLVASRNAVPVVVSQTAKETTTRSATVPVTATQASLLKDRTGDPEDLKDAPTRECQEVLLQCSGYSQSERLYGARDKITQPNYISR